LALALLVAGCSHDKSDSMAAGAGASASSEDVLKKDCANPKWREQNLGLWYSVCRQSLSW
jgi:hypothetical protein